MYTGHVAPNDGRSGPASGRPRVLLCANAEVRETVVTGEGVARLARIADLDWLPSEGVCDDPDVWGGPSPDPADAARLRERIGRAGQRGGHGVDILLVCHGAPYVDGPLLDAAPGLRMIGELVGDRFGNRIDVEAASARGIRVVDTTQGSSDPVAACATPVSSFGA